MSANDNPRLKELEEQISLKLKEGKYDEAERLSAQMIQLAEGETDFCDSGSDFDDNPVESRSESSSLSAGASDKPKNSRDDVENLKLLGMFSYILAGISFLIGFFPIFHIAFGAIMVFNPDLLPGSTPPDAENTIVGWIMLAVGLIVTFGYWIYAACMAYVGRCLRRQRRYTFSLIMACLSCLHMPLGTVLGVFTIIVLRKPSVKKLYGNY